MSRISKAVGVSVVIGMLFVGMKLNSVDLHWSGIIVLALIPVVATLVAGAIEVAGKGK